MLWRALFFGFLVAMPVGPTTIMFSRMVLKKQFTKAWVVALGVAFADIVLAYFACFGSRLLTVMLACINPDHLSKFFLGLYFVLSIALCTTGFLLWNRPLKVEPYTQENRARYFQVFASSFLITFLNPAAFVAFSALLPFFGLHVIPYWGVVLALIGAGSMVWWGVLMWTLNNTLGAQSKFLEHMHKVMAGVLYVLGGMALTRALYILL